MIIWLWNNNRNFNMAQMQFSTNKIKFVSGHLYEQIINEYMREHFISANKTAHTLHMQERFSKIYDYSLHRLVLCKNKKTIRKLNYQIIRND